MKNINRYKVITKVQNTPGVLARMTILFRKFNINIQNAEAKPLNVEKNVHEINFILETAKDENDFSIVMKKLERLVPVIEVSYQKI